MAELKIYRVGYVYDDVEGAGIIFSPWVQIDGMDEAIAAIPKYYASSEPDVEAEPIIIGWEEKTLDTDPA